ncbi:hypothetical protein HYV70_04715 [Candidatus Uhrbacteria bacterium]|nr:hypothetical protein [Candidatus Uhrbacteria bacterium]
MPPLFQPEDSLVFRSLPQQFLLIEEMYRIFKQLVDKGYDPAEALYAAFFQTHQTDEIPTSMGAQEFHRQMSYGLIEALNMVETVTKEFLKPFRKSLAPHNTIENCLDPIRMLKHAGTHPGNEAPSLKQRLHFEAHRQLGIALQIFSIEKNDPKLGVSEDLEQIDALSQERLFTSEESRDLWVVGLKDLKQQKKVVGVEFFPDEETATRLKKRTYPHILSTDGEMLMCRVVHAHGETFIIYVDSRYKSPFSTLLKLERGRTLSDRRGSKYVVVGTERNGRLHQATRQDAERFASYVKEILWKEPLLPREDISSENPHRNVDYWDCKIIGVFCRHLGSRTIAGPTELLITTIQDFLNENHARSETNHFLYRSKQIDDVLCKIWFPNTGDRYTDIPTFLSPHYGVNWDSPKTHRRLRRWRINQI